jgi:hypothetical protein
MDAAAIMPIERGGNERRKRTVFGVLKCLGVGLAECQLGTPGQEMMATNLIYIHTDRSIEEQGTTHRQTGTGGESSMTRRGAVMPQLDHAGPLRMAPAWGQCCTSPARRLAGDSIVSPDHACVIAPIVCSAKLVEKKFTRACSKPCDRAAL